MNRIIFLLHAITFPILLFSQLETEAVTYDYQIAYCVGESPSTAWIGESVVVMIEGETANDRDPAIMETIVNTFEDIINTYEEITGLIDLPIASSYQGKPVIEVVIDNCGAGGLASHGVLGMSTGTYFLNEFYDLVMQGNIAVPQVFLYELNRNFWASGMDGFNGKFDWAMNDEAQNYGWWTVGMNNAQAYIIPKILDIGMYYFGNDIDYWENRMVKELQDYMDDTQYDFDYGWRQSLMPWHPTESINDLMSGLLIYSYNNFGGENWIRGFYTQMQNEAILNRSNVFAYQECRDNVYKVWSLAANTDLIDFFIDDLRWFISEDAQDFVKNNLTVSNVASIDLGEIPTVFPNPASENLTIRGIGKSHKTITITSASGKVIDHINSDGNMHQVIISNYDPGLYFALIGEHCIKFVIQ